MIYWDGHNNNTEFGQTLKYIYILEPPLYLSLASFSQGSNIDTTPLQKKSNPAIEGINSLWCLKVYLELELAHSTVKLSVYSRFWCLIAEVHSTNSQQGPFLGRRKGLIKTRSTNQGGKLFNHSVIDMKPVTENSSLPLWQHSLEYSGPPCIDCPTQKIIPLKEINKIISTLYLMTTM